MRLFGFLVVLWCLAAACAEMQKYDGYKVYRLTVESQEQMDFLADLKEKMADLDFWSGVNMIKRPVDVMVAPADEESFLETVKKQGIDVKVFIEDVQKLIENEVVTNDGRTGMNWVSYHPLENIHSWMDNLAKANSNVSIIDAGMSFENRQLKGVKISFGVGKRAVFIEGGIHAREWISPATVTYLINQLLTSKDPSFRKIADNFDWYLFPVINPDGYKFTFTNSRLWRKNRSRNSGCYGVDPNRNWDVYWGVAGTSNKPCAETYGGSKAFSEVETSSLAKFISTIGPSLDAYLAFHSYGQMLLMPYGHTSQHLENHDEVLRIGKAAIKALARRYRTRYVVGNVAETIYESSGGSMDWVKMTYKTPIAFTYELRDRGRSGFLLPAYEIEPNCLEVMDSIMAMFQEGEKLGYFKLE